MIGSNPTYDVPIREPLTLINNWKVYPDSVFGWVEVMMDAQGTCALNGLVVGGTPPSVIAMLPPSYRPTYYEFFTGVSYLSGTYSAAGIYIGPDGSVVVNSAGTDFVSLNNVIWKVGSG